MINTDVNPAVSLYPWLICFYKMNFQLSVTQHHVNIGNILVIRLDFKPLLVAYQCENND